MTKAHLLTIGTEITSGEVVNSNASWLSQRLERLGVRVHSHLTVRDQREEILSSLNWPLSTVADGAETEPLLVFVTGGLGPTSDDLTRACMAEHLGVELEFDDEVWAGLNALYEQRGLPVREAHRHQCWFPKGSERLNNPVGTALGFYSLAHRTPTHPLVAHYFILPGPPRELEGLFNQEVEPRIRQLVQKSDLTWHRWSVFAVPESEVAELVEPLIAGSGVEVGYRAQVPYVRVKLFANRDRHGEILRRVGEVLEPSLVAYSVDGELESSHDLAERLLGLWPDSVLRVTDDVSEGQLALRLFGARRSLKSDKDLRLEPGGLSLLKHGDEFQVEVSCSQVKKTFAQKLPFKLGLDSERGRRAAAEWALWLAVAALKSK